MPEIFDPAPPYPSMADVDAAWAQVDPEYRATLGKILHEVWLWACELGVDPLLALKRIGDCLAREDQS